MLQVQKRSGSSWNAYLRKVGFYLKLWKRQQICNRLKQNVRMEEYFARRQPFDHSTISLQKNIYLNTVFPQ